MNICALSTAKGGAIAVIRVSGPDAISIVSGLFVSSRKGKSLNNAKGQTLHYGTFVAPKSPLCPLSVPRDSVAQSPSPKGDGWGEASSPIDDVLVSVFRAPHSYTGENAVEISCHGSSYIINSILQALISSGCRQAQPGEFTQRAFLNGKMDLSQAEAVADIIASTNAATHRMAMSQLRGNFSSELATLREKLLHLTSLMELELDFSDHEDLEFADRTELLQISHSIFDHIQHLSDSFKVGKALKGGVPVAIVGKTNVGKSTLLNRLLHEDKAIVSDIHGTTRDVIEDTINIRGIDFRFIDTAGLRQTEDKIERIGIERTHKKIQEAAIIIHLADNPDDFNAPITYPFPTNESQSSPKILRVLNKIDALPSQSVPCDSAAGLPILPISAKQNININRLEDALVAAADIPEIKENDIIVTSARHYEALIKAQEALQRVLDGMNIGIPTDLLSEDLRQCLTHLADITGGQISTNEVLSNIFSHFCIGK